MRRYLRHLFRQAATYAVALLLALALIVGAAPPPAARAAVSPGGAFGSAVPCLTAADQFAVTRYDNTVYTNVSPPVTPAAYPALQTVVNGAFTTQAFHNSIGSVYGMAYDDGNASGRERLFVGAYTKRLVAYGPQGPGGIYVFERAGSGWVLVGSFAVPGAVGVTHSSAGSAPVDQGALAGVGTTALGGMVVSPDGTALYVVNVGRKRIERFTLASVGMPAYDRSFDISFSSISSDPAVLSDLTPFALAWYNYPAASGQPLLLIGVTDTARRGLNISGGAEMDPKLSGANFTVPPRAYVIMLNPVTGWYGKVAGADLDLGNDPVFTNRHTGGGFATWTWAPTQPQYPVRGWNPWRNQLGNIAGAGYEMHYPQPLLTDIQIVRDTAPTAATPEPRGLLVLGIRDRTGDMAFNGGTTVPAGERSAIAQGDTVTLRWSGSGYTLVGADYYNDNALPLSPAAPNAHIENHQGALARIPGTGTNVGSAGDTMVGTTLGGENNQGLRTWANNAGAGGLGSYTNVIDAASHAATKASNLGDVEVLCSYALVGGRVWNDANSDSIQNGADGGISGVTVELFRGNSPLTAPTVASATTDAQGRYLFAIPPNANVNIRLSAASRAALQSQGYRGYTRENVGGNDTADSDASQYWGYIEFARPGTGYTTAAIVSPWRESDGRSFDIGISRAQPTGSIGDRVWSDANGNGVQDAGESGVSGATVYLEGVDTATLGTISLSTTTSSSGVYGFNYLPPGRYRVRFAVPAGMRASPRDQGSDDTRDSDADAASGYYTPVFDLAESQARNEWDFGLTSSTDVAITKAAPASVTFGDSFSYTLEAINHSGTAVPNVVVADTLPASVNYVSSSPSHSTRSGQSLTWNLGTLAAYERRTVRINVSASSQAGSGGLTTWTIQNCASITTTTVDSNPANNSACASTVVRRVEVSLTASGPSPVLVGDPFDITVVYTNASELPAPNASLNIALPSDNLTFFGWKVNPDGACTVISAASLRCALGTLAPGVSGSVVYTVRPELLATGLLPGRTYWWTPTLRHTIIPSSGTWPGDNVTNNVSGFPVQVVAPNLGVTPGITPSPLPVGEPGSITASYRNTGVGLARSAALTITHDPGAELGALPTGCTYTAASRRAVCDLGDLAAGATGTVVLPLRLPATPADAATYAANTFGATAEIGSATPEREEHRADNTASAQVDVVRPNVYVTAAGPANAAPPRIGWGTYFFYDVGYGNLYAAQPHLTRAAENTVLTVTLPDDVVFQSATLSPTLVSGQVLTWNLGTLAPRQQGTFRITVQTDVPAGTLLHLDADISTTTPGDDPSDNHAEVDTLVQPPPSSVPDATGLLRLLIHSTLDPLHGGANTKDAVYLTESDSGRIAWPAGEVLDFTPRLSELTLSALPFPYEYRARVTGWSVTSFEVNGVEKAATGADSRGMIGCRGAGTASDGGSALQGCTYSYVGAYPDGRAPDAALPPVIGVTEDDMARQGHVYWTQPPAPTMRNDVYLYTVSPLAPAKLTVQVEVEVWVVNAYPGLSLEPPVWTYDPIEMPGLRRRHIITQPFTVTLIVPRSVVGPGQ